MHTRIFCLLTLAFGLRAPGIQAEQHEILLVEGGFFPEITYLSAGDTILFINMTDVAENVVATDASWSTTQISSEQTDSVVVTEDMVLTFEYDEGSDDPKTGSLSFDPAPLGIEVSD